MMRSKVRRLNPGGRAAPRRRPLAVRITKPQPSVTQSGRANCRHWMVTFEPRSRPFIEPLMGWTGSSDTLQQVRLKFSSLDRAIDFAEKQGWDYTVQWPPGSAPGRAGRRQIEDLDRAQPETVGHAA